jgi:hypothetical protein
MRLSVLALSVCLFSCGRTEPVRYFTYGDAGVTPPDGGMRGPDGGLLCVDGMLTLTPARPVVMLVVDRSTSMNQSFPGTGTSKWLALRGALHGALPPWNDTLELGLHLFPEGGTNSCTVAGTPEIPPAFQNVDAVLGRLDGASPGGSTPTALAIQNAGAAISGIRTAGSAKALVLATDGAPDCNANLPAATCTCVGGGTCAASRCLDDTRTLAAISTLAASGVPTWVIGLRSSNDALFLDVLNRMADAGGRPQTGSEHFFSATSQAALESALTEIRRQVGDCHYLTTSVPDLGGAIELHIEGDFVPYDVTGTEGWSWIDAGNGELALHGDACTRAKAVPASALSVVVTCGP